MKKPTRSPKKVTNPNVSHAPYMPASLAATRRRLRRQGSDNEPSATKAVFHCCVHYKQESGVPTKWHILHLRSAHVALSAYGDMWTRPISLYSPAVVSAASAKSSRGASADDTSIKTFEPSQLLSHLKILLHTTRFIRETERSPLYATRSSQSSEAGIPLL
ncbi:uncharacterized protein EI90DRAFT_3070503 [Cantharellus anzutake]|uniref:uncharacterized protein n=1 Tax=Cantharellus anzutake TaxID=1750568 RepID=UPI0019086F9B|nr:uncharacterized protein EI90DRAFT_3070503 [Cantharellus anzutake]KAF8326330.1 hypothetical protein EI90DRAFT_3070503 [Cantharellus anzutake]